MSLQWPLRNIIGEDLFYGIMSTREFLSVVLVLYVLKGKEFYSLNEILASLSIYSLSYFHAKNIMLCQVICLVLRSISVISVMLSSMCIVLYVPSTSKVPSTLLVLLKAYRMLVIFFQSILSCLGIILKCSEAFCSLGGLENTKSKQKLSKMSHAFF